MARARRTRFAASFVAVVAAGGCSHNSGGGVEINGRRAQRVWSINGAVNGPGTCSAFEWNECPPDVHCNPPPPITIACPQGVPTDGTARIVSFDGTTCELEATHAPIDCPKFGSAPPPPPPPSVDAAVAAVATPPLRRWQVTRKPDGTCEGFDDPCSRMQRKPGDPIPPCNPPPPKPMKCPPFIQSYGTIDEQRPGVCVVVPPPTSCPPNAHCNPPEPAVVDCP